MDALKQSFFSMMGDNICGWAKEETEKFIKQGVTLQNLQRDYLSLSRKATDVETEIKNAELWGQKRRKVEVDGWLEEVKKLRTDISALGGEVQSENFQLENFISSFIDGGRAAKLQKRVDELVEQSKNFSDLVLDAPKTMGERLLVPKLVGKAFEENLEKIWKWLEDDNVTSIGIYGMGGVGKTTLIKYINNKIVKEKTQEFVFWVTVSQESNITKLQDKIAHALKIDLSDENDEDKRASKLYRTLSSLRKKFVLILDDVRQNISLEKVGIPLHVEGSRLIITTRSLQVCRQIGCHQKVILVKKLDVNEAWKLFIDTLGEEETFSQVEEIAKSMAEKCDGLPLGIISLAGSMRGETAIHVWSNAWEELQKSVMDHEDMEEHVFKVLKYSFDRLNPKHQEQENDGSYTELQCCFLYCSLYPEDHMIEKDELVRKFISEELVDRRKTRKAQIAQGHTILDRLVNVCLLESIDNSYVKMHDLVRAMALKITQGKNMVLAGLQLKRIPNEDGYWAQDVDKMSLMFNYIKEIPNEMSPNCPHLSALLLQGNNCLKFIADAFFSQMHGLCVLDLSYSEEIPNLPSSLSELESLKALILGGCRKLAKVPNLGKLKQLKELDLSHTAIREVPQGMDKLFNLQFLSLHGANALERLPPGLIRNFPNLQFLRLPTQILPPTAEMEGLTKLEEFNGQCVTDGEYGPETPMGAGRPQYITADMLNSQNYIIQPLPQQNQPLQ